MRLLLIILLISSVCHGQTMLGTQVTLTKQNGTAGEFLNELNNIRGIAISYSSGVIDLTRKIELKGTERTVEDILKIILKDLPVKYLERDGKILLIATEPVKKKFTISGYISDKKSGERLIGTSFYIMNKKQGTTSNNYGFFSLTTEEDSIDLLISHAGYISQGMRVDLRQDVVLDVGLEQRIIINEIVVVNSESKANTQNRTIPGRITISPSLIKSIPALLGEADVLKALQLLPGIQASNEGSSGLTVRGGSTDQNLVLLDGVPVYNASHAFGLFSIFNADAVQNVEVLKGGFPASYGGRLSSVIDVQMKEGDKNKFHGEGGIGLIFSKFTFEGPIKKKKSSFLVSLRRTYLDLILNPILQSESGIKVKTYFSDIIAKTNFPIGESDRVYFSFYTGRDNFVTEEEYSKPYQKYKYGISWGNVTSTIRWNHEYHKKLFSNLTFNYSRFRFNALEKNDLKEDSNSYTQRFEQKYFSQIRDLILKYDIDYLPSPDHFIKIGMAATLHHYRPGVKQVYEADTIVKVSSTVDNHSVYSGEYDLYAEDDIRLSAKMKANIGVRFSGFNVGGNVFLSIQPRVNWLYKLTDKWSLKASAVKMNQYIHLLTNSNLGLPTDLWVPVTKRVPPQISYQFSGGISYNHDRSLEASMEIYYKHLANVIEYQEGTGFNSAYTNWQDIVEVGKGNTYGAEWLLQKRKGKLTGLVSYTLSWANRKFETINGGRSFPYKYDRRHEVKTAVIWKPSAKVEWGMDWILATGNAISLPVGYYLNPYTNRYIDIYTERNNYRMPLYHRLDASVKFIRQKRHYQRTWIISVYNLYNRLNPFFIYTNTYRIPGAITGYEQTSVFPILPSFSYQIKF